MEIRSAAAPLALLLALAGGPARAEEPPRPDSEPSDQPAPADDEEGEIPAPPPADDEEGEVPAPPDAPPQPEPQPSDPETAPGGVAVPPPAGDAEVELLRTKLELMRLRLDALEAAPSAAPPPAKAPPNVFNPRITGFIDLGGNLTLSDDGVRPAFDVRAFELDMRADIDPFAKAVVVLGFENPLLHAIEAQDDEADDGADAAVAEEVGEAWLSVVEEANITLVALPAHLLLELGMVRVDFGSLNRQHLHDVPHLDYPGALSGLLGEEGWNDAGVFLRYRLHNPKSLPIDFKIGVMSRGPEPLMERRKTPTPIVLGRFTGSADLPTGGLFEGGFSYWQDASDDAAGFHLASGDLLLKVRPRGRGQYRSFFLQGEAYFAERFGPGGQRSLAGFVGIGVQPARNVFVSLRGDALVEDLSNIRIGWGAGIAASFYTSEFLRIRLAYDVLTEAEIAHRLGLQVTAVFGSHPVEPYWVNR